MPKTRRLPRFLAERLFRAIDVAEIRKMKKHGASREDLIVEVEEQLEALIEAVDTGRDFMELYPDDQERMEHVKEIVEWAIGEVNPETFVRRALRARA